MKIIWTELAVEKLVEFAAYISRFKLSREDSKYR